MAKIIAVDFDGTLVKSLEDPTELVEKVGPTIEAMVWKVKAAIEGGATIVIFSARFSEDGSVTPAGTADAAFASAQKELVGAWCEKTFGTRFEMTAWKSPLFDEIWDDRAIRVIVDTGDFFHEQLQRRNLYKIMKKEYNKTKNNNKRKH